jgi:uncharacterized protein YpbB
MFATQLIVSIFARYNNQRGASAVYHLFKGKKSGQTIQDVGLFQLYPFFSITPKLDKTQYDTYIEKLIEKQFILLTENNVVVTDKGWQLIENFDPAEFDGWHFRGREHLFFKRLALTVQTLSFLPHTMRFIPIERDGTTQRFVKSYLQHHHFQETAFQQQFTAQLHDVLARIPVSDIAKQVFVYRLSGYEQSGLTWHQLSELLEEDAFSLQLLFVQCLHSVLNEARLTAPLIDDLAQQIRIEQVLTQSTQKTATLFYQGYSMEQIARYRRLKLSTIEDHLAEMAMNDDKFPLHQFVNDEEAALVVHYAKALQTTKLRALKEVMPQLSYFQIRLVLAAKGA